MKKKTLVVVVLVMLLSLIFVASGCSTKNDFNVEKGNEYDVADLAYNYLEALGTTFADRTSGTGREIPFLEFLSLQMLNYGYEFNYKDEVKEGVHIPGAMKYTYYNAQTNTNSGSGFKGTNYGYNMEFIKKAEGESLGTIILSTQYDNLYSFDYDPTSADGSYESGASTAALLAMANEIKDLSLKYDVKIVFYGGGSYNWEGASNYLGKLNTLEVDSILLAIDLGQIIGGDSNYAYTLDKKSDYGNFVNSVVKSNDLDFKDVPKDKRIANGKLIEEGLYNYFHIGMLNNNIFMMNRGIPTLNIMSHNWEDRSVPLRTEIKGEQNLYQTRADTLENMIARVGSDEIKKDFNTISNLVLNLIGEKNQDALVEALSTARDQMPSHMAQSDMTSMILGIALKMLLIIAVIVIMIRMRKIVQDKHDHYTQMLYKQKSVVEEKPIDVFGWDSDKKDNNNSGEDGEVIDGEVIKPSDDDDIFSDL